MRKIIPGLLLVLLMTSCSNENRYELELSSQNDYTRTMLVDKKTGTVWSYYKGKWTNYGTPPKDAPEKGDSFKRE